MGVLDPVWWLARQVTRKKELLLKHLFAISIALLPSAVLAEQFTPEQLIEVMTKSPRNRGVRVHDDRLGGGDGDFDDLVIGDG